MCSVAEFETLSTAESMWFPGVSLSDVSVSFRCHSVKHWKDILLYKERHMPGEAPHSAVKVAAPLKNT